MPNQPPASCVSKRFRIDFVLLGRAAILHHDFPLQMQADSNFTPVSNPVSTDHLREQGLGEAFITYMSSWKGFVS